MQDLLQKNKSLRLQFARQTQDSSLFSANNYYKLGSLVILSLVLSFDRPENWKQECHQLIAEAEVILTTLRQENDPKLQTTVDYWEGYYHNFKTVLLIEEGKYDKAIANAQQALTLFE